MEKDKNLIEKIVLSFILILYLAGNISVFVLINENQIEEYPKLIVKGEILDMDFWNMTTDDVNPNFNLISREKENLTIYYYNLTIFNKLTSSIINYTFEESIINHFNIQIGSIIEIYEFHPFLEIKVFNK